MSRLGRNYVQMGMLREQLRRANVRLIAVNEGVDIGSGFDNDFLRFRDVINEYYAKDISKEKSKTVIELAYTEVIGHNKKNLERELQNETRADSISDNRTRRNDGRKN